MLALLMFEVLVEDKSVDNRMMATGVKEEEMLRGSHVWCLYGFSRSNA